MSSDIQKENETGKDRLRRALLKASTLFAIEGDEDQAKESRLDQQLASRLKLVEGEKEDSEEKDEKEDIDETIEDTHSVRNAFVDKSIEILQDVNDALLKAIQSDEDQESGKELVGVRDLRLIHTMIQVIVSWGIYPCLEPGVGVPLSKRVKSGYTKHGLFANDQDTTAMDPTSAESRRRLFQLTKALVDVVAETHLVPKSRAYTTVGSLLLSRYLPDMFASLLQLAYRPPIKRQRLPVSSASTVPTDPSNIFALHTQVQSVDLSNTERDKCARMVMWLFDRSDVHRCMEALMLLLGTSPLHPVPGWLRNICGRFLSKILLREEGIATVLEFTIGDAEEVHLDQLEKMSQLVLSVPQQIPSVERYYDLISPQLLALLQASASEDKRVKPTITQAVTFIIGKMIANHTDIAKRTIIDKITGYFVGKWEQKEPPSMESDESGLDPEVISEKDIQTLLQVVHRVLIGGEPSPVVIQSFLGDSISAWYHLYDFTVKSKSGLRETVLDLLASYFRIVTTKEGVDALKRIMFNKIDSQGYRLAYFAPGPTGGVSMRIKREPKPLSGNEMHVDPAMMVEFLKKLDNIDLLGDLFVFLLNEYSARRGLGEDEDPKIMLLLLQLIMALQDTLGPQVFSKPTQIIAFACNIIQDQADRMSASKERKEKKKGKSNRIDIANIVSEEDRAIFEDETTAQDIEEEFESLMMAMSLLRAVMHENDNLDIQANQLLESIIAPLKTIESFKMDILSETIQELLIAVTSFVSANQMSNKSKGKNAKTEASLDRYREAMKALQDDLLPVRAHGMTILRDMVLSKDALVSLGEGLDNVLTIFVQLIQDEDSYIYLNAIKGLSALTDAHGNKIIQKLGAIYSDEKQSVDHRLRVGEALLQTVRRSGEALSKYIYSLVAPLEAVLARRNVNSHLKVSALSIISVACETCPSALYPHLRLLTDWVLNILEIEKTVEIRRAAIVVILSLFRGLADDALYQYPQENLKRTYRTLRYIEETDADELTRHQARTALSDLDAIMRREMFKGQ